MSEIYEALTGIGVVFLMLIFFMSNKDLATNHKIRPWKIVGFLSIPLVKFLSIGYFIYKKKRVKERQVSEEY